MKCEKCNSNIPDGNLFCGKCGQPVSQPAQPSPEPQKHPPDISSTPQMASTMRSQPPPKKGPSGWLITLFVGLGVVGFICIIVVGILSLGILGFGGSVPASQPQVIIQEPAGQEANSEQPVPTIDEPVSVPDQGLVPKNSDSGVSFVDGVEVFQDNFSSEFGWDQTVTERFTIGRAEGGIYRMDFTREGDYDFKISPQPHTFSLHMDDVYIKVRAGAENSEGAYGLVCRYFDDRNLYLFDLSNSGRYRLYKIVNGDWISLTGSKEEQSSVIMDVNTIEMLCMSHSITVLVNGKQIVSVIDSEHEFGNAGLYAQPFGGESDGRSIFSVWFDDFYMEVYPPGEG